MAWYSVDGAWSDRLFQCGRGLETNRFARLHLDGFTRPRIEALPRFCLPNRERSEAWQGKLTTFFEFFNNGVHQIASRAIRGGARQIDGFFQNLRQKGFRHGFFPMVIRCGYALSAPHASSSRVCPMFSHRCIATSADSQRLVADFMSGQWIRPVA